LGLLFSAVTVTVCDSCAIGYDDACSGRVVGAKEAVLFGLFDLLLTW